MNGWWISERREWPRKAHLWTNTGCIRQKRNAAGTSRRPKGAVRFYVHQAPLTSGLMLMARQNAAHLATLA